MKPLTLKWLQPASLVPATAVSIRYFTQTKNYRRRWWNVVMKNDKRKVSRTVVVSKTTWSVFNYRYCSTHGSPNEWDWSVHYNMCLCFYLVVMMCLHMLSVNLCSSMMCSCYNLLTICGVCLWMWMVYSGSIGWCVCCSYV